MHIEIYVREGERIVRNVVFIICLCLQKKKKKNKPTRR